MNRFLKWVGVVFGAAELIPHDAMRPVVPEVSITPEGKESCGEYMPWGP